MSESLDTQAFYSLIFCDPVQSRSFISDWFDGRNFEVTGNSAKLFPKDILDSNGCVVVRFKGLETTPSATKFSFEGPGSKPVAILRHVPGSKESKAGHRSQLVLWAKGLQKAGLIPLPVSKEKKPPFLKEELDRAKLYKDEPWTDARIESLFSNQNVVGVAILLGPVLPKYDLVCFDLEKSGLWEKLIAEVNARQPALAKRVRDSYREISAGGGHHFFAWVLSGLAKPEKNINFEIMASKNSYAVIAPSKATSEKNGPSALGHYTPVNGPILENGKPRFITLNSEEFEALKAFMAVCRPIEAPKPPEVQPMPSQTAIIPQNQLVVEPAEYEIQPTLGGGEKKIERANRFYKESFGWPRLLERFGSRVQGGGPPWKGWHDESTSKETNCICGPRNPGDSDSFWCFGTNSKFKSGKAYSYVGFCIANGMTYKGVFDEVDQDWGPMPVESSRFDFLSNSGPLEPFNSDSHFSRIDPKNIVAMVFRDLLGVCDDFETPNISWAGAHAIMALVFGWFKAKRSDTGREITTSLYQLILADTCAGKNGPVKYLTELLLRLNAKMKNWVNSEDYNEYTTRYCKEVSMMGPEIPNYAEAISQIGMGSVEGLEDKLRGNRVRFVYCDELADFLEARKAGDTSSKQLSFLKTYYSPARVMASRDLSTNNKGEDEVSEQAKGLVSPVVIFLGFAQPSRIKAKGVLIESDFSGGTISRNFVFAEGYKTNYRPDGSMNIPVREGGLPSEDLIEIIFQRVTELVKHGGRIGFSEKALEYLREAKIKRFNYIYPKERAGTYSPSVDGRGPENAYRAAVLYAMCKSEGWQSVEVTDLELGVAYHEAGVGEVRKLSDLVVGFPLKPYIEEFIHVAAKLKDANKSVTRTTILQHWKFRTKHKDAKDSAWMKATLEPELEKQGFLRVLDTKAGTYEVIQ